MEDFINLYNQFLQITKEGDEEKIKEFLINNFNNFPDDLKTNLLGIFFEEAVDQTYYALKGEIDYFSQLLETKEALERIKEILENKKREIEIREEIMGSE